jgi:succinate-semialdehyde dehydrogenase/glutarate-semialdehyde dehydrogenase
LKKVTLELGGNCPFLIFDDADLNQAADGKSPRSLIPKYSANQNVALMALKWRHAGQACITANRVYVQKGVYDKFAEMLKQKTSKLVVGHGAEKGTTMGPVTTPRSLDKALNQVEDAKKHGGQVILGGGKVIGKSGYFFEPTIILGAKKEMLITSEETFAPVLALYSFDTEEEAVTAANNTSVSISAFPLKFD